MWIVQNGHNRNQDVSSTYEKIKCSKNGNKTKMMSKGTKMKTMMRII